MMMKAGTHLDLSGTEPKIKLYIYTKAKSLEEAGNKVRDIEKAVRMVMEAV